MAVSITVIDDLDRCVRATLAAIHEESATVAYAHIFDSPFPTEDTRQRWDRYEGSVAVARDGDAVIGFVAWYDDECDALYVRPSAAGAGVGGLLLEKASTARRLCVLADNENARSFYARRGWTPSGLTRRQNGDVQELEYVRDLPSLG